MAVVGTTIEGLAPLWTAVKRIKRVARAKADTLTDTLCNRLTAARLGNCTPMIIKGDCTQRNTRTCTDLRNPEFFFPTKEEALAAARVKLAHKIEDTRILLDRLLIIQKDFPS